MELKRNNNQAPPPDEASPPKRETWSSKWEFLLSCVGLSVGVGNVWRFPFLAYQNGGGAFLVPYLIMLVLAGKPMYFLELTIGQFASCGPLRVWRCAPITRGIGVSMILVCLVVSIYYNVIMCYTLFYISQSFQSPLPWETCDQSWANGTNCTVRQRNTTYSNTSEFSGQVYWERKVLEISPGIEYLGSIKWDLAVCLAISWLIVMLCVIKGVRSSGKVAYFSATFPYVVLIILLIASVMQTGAWNGIKYFIVPDWEKLIDITVWRDAAGQMFYSLTLSFGALIMYSSYNDFRHNIFRDAMTISYLDTLTSIIAGLVIFSAIGALAHDLGSDDNIREFVKSGPGLAFVAYPEALTRLPCPQLWSILFFLMMFMLGLDSEFALVENVLTCFADEFKSVRQHKIKFCVGLCLCLFLLGLSCVTRGGQFIFNLLDECGGTMTLVFIAVLECTALAWVYGYKNLQFDINFMLQRKLSWYWYLTWCFTGPIVLAFIFIYSLVLYKPLSYGDAYTYPTWANVCGVCLTLVIVLPIPIWAVFEIARQKGTLINKIKMARRPHCKWGPRDEQLKFEWNHQKSGVFNMLSVINGQINSYFEQSTSETGIDNRTFKNDI